MSRLKKITEARNLEDKKVLVRVDWNVPIVDGKVVDDFRIRKSMSTLKYLEEAGARMILATHMDPDGASVEPLREFVPAGAELLENLRHNPGEKNGDLDFAKFLAGKADIFVNEAFSASHREHASIVGIPEFLPSYAGMQFAAEVEHLSRTFNPEHPFLLILGGAKFETKLPVLSKFVDIADNIFVGGALAHNFFIEMGKKVGDSLVSPGDFSLASLLESGKITLPENLRIKTSRGTIYDTIDYVGDRDVIVDAGPKDLDKLAALVKEARTVLWNGPLGNYEKGFVDSTVELAELLAHSDKETIIGGGDTIAAIRHLGLDKFSFVSTAGGAMLRFLAEGTLPGIKALQV